MKLSKSPLRLNNPPHENSDSPDNSCYRSWVTKYHTSLLPHWQKLPLTGDFDDFGKSPQLWLQEARRHLGHDMMGLVWWNSHYRCRIQAM